MDAQVIGLICSPATCARVLQRAAEDSGTNTDVMVQQVKDHCYVDEWIMSFDSEKEAVKCTVIGTRALKNDSFELSLCSSLFFRATSCRHRPGFGWVAN